jgi:WS/DGAT/MGAT family acyltransferase
VDVPIERASGDDLAMLVLEGRGAVPVQIGVALVLDVGRGFDPREAVAVLSDRVRGVPRLRQRLVRPGPGLGRPVWVDDLGFDAGRHLRVVRCPAPGDEAALLALAGALVTDPLPRDRPLWRGRLVIDLAGDRAALVLVLHHVLADGLGGVAVLARLVDGAPPGEPAGSRPRPARRRLAEDAWRARLGAVAGVGRAWRELRASLEAAGGLRPPRAAPCSLLAPTGPHRAFAVARADLGRLRLAAHAAGGTVDDALLVAHAAAFADLLERRGEHLQEVRTGVPMAVRRQASAAAPGNRVVPLLVGVPVTGPAGKRIAHTGAAVRTARAAAGARAPITVLQPLLRLAAATGLYGVLVRRQRRLHTLVSNVRGPTAPVAVAGAPVTAMIPFSVGEAGNITVSAVALSYAGTLTVTLVVDPDQVPELATLADALGRELASLAEATRT